MNWQPRLANADFVYDCAQRYRHGKMNTEISPNDTMSGEHYFEIGHSAADCILKGLCVAGSSNVQRVLDIPCGHGRVLRHLLLLFPDAHIDACDLDQEGVAFCKSSFGVNGIFSEPDLTKAALQGNYDLIWVGSLFTHLPRQIAQRWLAHLTTLLSRTGIVIATTHGRWCEYAYDKAKYISEDKWGRIISDYRISGHGYASYDRSENHEFIEHEYGISISRPYVTIKDIETIPSVRIYGYMERAWADHHDVVVLGRPGFDASWE